MKIGRDQFLFTPLQQAIGMAEREQHSEFGAELLLERFQAAVPAAGVALSDPGRQVVHPLTAQHIQAVFDAAAVKLAIGPRAAAVSRQSHLAPVGLKAELLHREPPGAAAAVGFPVTDFQFEMDRAHQPSLRHT
jgi:hypothetical protein